MQDGDKHTLLLVHLPVDLIGHELVGSFKNNPEVYSSSQVALQIVISGNKALPEGLELSSSGFSVYSG